MIQSSRTRANHIYNLENSLKGMQTKMGCKCRQKQSNWNRKDVYQQCEAQPETATIWFLIRPNHLTGQSQRIFLTPTDKFCRWILLEYCNTKRAFDVLSRRKEVCFIILVRVYYPLTSSEICNNTCMTKTIHMRNWLCCFWMAISHWLRRFIDFLFKVFIY